MNSGPMAVCAQALAAGTLRAKALRLVLFPASGLSADYRSFKFEFCGCVNLAPDILYGFFFGCGLD
jgi:hypothetical protein